MKKIKVAALLSVVTLFAFALQGYHPGAEDDGVYLSAIKHDLAPHLYPFNSSFFTMQLQATVFDKFVALFTRLTHLPLNYALLLLQLGSIFVLLLGCWRILGWCFTTLSARLAGVFTIACLLSLSVAGTALYLNDEHLHPRVLATDAIVLALDSLGRGKKLRAVLLLIASGLFHPIMAAFGVSLCLMYLLVEEIHSRPAEQAATGRWALAASAGPASWIFAPANPAWHAALAQHHYYSLGGWEWYELLGAFAPPVLLWMLARLGRNRHNPGLQRLATVTAIYSVFQLAVALAMLLPPQFARLAPLQPMRYLHLTFLLMFLLAGGALGEYFLHRAHLARWVAIFACLAALNGYAQRLRYPSTPNLELPWTAPAGPWLQAFDWVRENTPQDAVFALDPLYLSLPGEDNHGFRALAERSSLTDDLKDAAVAVQVPSIAGVWLAQHQLQQGWRMFSRADFAHLARETPARWALVFPRQARADGLNCPYTNERVSVCHLPTE